LFCSFPGLHRYDFSLQGTCSLDRLQDRDHVARANTQGIQTVHQLLQANASIQDG